jgi:hypothetical protein
MCITRQVSSIPLQLAPRKIDHLTMNTTLLHGLGNEGSRVSVIGPDALETWNGLPDALQGQPSAVAIGAVGGMDDNAQEVALRIDQNMALSSCDVLGASEATNASRMRFDRLALNDRRTRGRITTGMATSRFTNMGRDVLPRPIQPPVTNETLDRRPGTVFPWQIAPGTASTQDVKQSVGHAAHIHGTRSAAWLNWRNAWGQQGPLSICEIARIQGKCHCEAPPEHISDSLILGSFPLRVQFLISGT